MSAILEVKWKRELWFMRMQIKFFWCTHVPSRIIPNSSNFFIEFQTTKSSEYLTVSHQLLWLRWFVKKNSCECLKNNNAFSTDSEKAIAHSYNLNKIEWSASNGLICSKYTNGKHFIWVYDYHFSERCGLFLSIIMKFCFVPFFCLNNESEHFLQKKA